MALVPHRRTRTSWKMASWITPTPRTPAPKRVLPRGLSSPLLRMCPPLASPPLHHTLKSTLKHHVRTFRRRGPLLPLVTPKCLDDFEKFQSLTPAEPPIRVQSSSFEILNLFFGNKFLTSHFSNSHLRTSRIQLSLSLLSRSLSLHPSTFTHFLSYESFVFESLFSYRSEGTTDLRWGGSDDCVIWFLLMTARVPGSSFSQNHGSFLLYLLPSVLPKLCDFSIFAMSQ